MIGRILLAICFLTFITLLQGQEYVRPSYDHYWWVNGDLIDVRDTTYPRQSTTTYIITDRSISCLYDESSDITYTTNGNYIFASTGDTITGSDSLSYHPSTGEDGAGWLILGMPGPDLAMILPGFDGNSFSVFHIGIEYPVDRNNPLLPHLYQSTVVRTPDPPYGYVSEKREIVFSDTLDQGLSAVRHGNGRDWYLILNSRSREEQHVLRYDAGGVHHVATQEFDHDLNTSDADTVRLGTGESLFSPDGNLYAKIKFNWPDTILSKYVTLYTFDRCNGQLEEWLDFRIPDYTFPTGPFLLNQSIAFSANSRYLYVSDGFNMYQYDLYVEDVLASRSRVFDFFTQPPADPGEGEDYFESIRLTANGEIVIGSGGTRTHLHRLARPNRKADSTNLRWKAIDDLSSTQGYLPIFPHYGIGPLENSPCDTLGIDYPPPLAAFEYVVEDSSTLEITFYDSSSIYVTDWAWSFGDGSFSDEVHPVHFYDTLGAYQVCLTVTAPSGSHTACEWLYLGVEPPSNTTEIEQQLSLSIFPNPATGAVTIQMPDNSQGRQLEMYDINGRIVATYAVGREQQFHLPLQGLRPSLYLLVLMTEDGRRYRGRLVVQ